MNSCRASTSGFRDGRRRPGLATPATDILVKSLIKPFFISLSIQLNISIKILRSNETKQIKIKEKSKVIDVLEKFKIKPDTVITTLENKPIPIDEKLKDGQELTILQVSSGG